MGTPSLPGPQPTPSMKQERRWSITFHEPSSSLPRRRLPFPAHGRLFGFGLARAGLGLPLALALSPPLTQAACSSEPGGRQT